MRSLHSRSGRRGGAAVEFALILPPLFAILTGLMDYGWFFTNQHVLNNVAHATAREAAMTPAGGDAAARAQAKATQTWDAMGLPGTPAVTVQVSGTPQVAVVTLSVQEPYLVGLVPTPTSASVSVQRRMEVQPVNGAPSGNGGA